MANYVTNFTLPDGNTYYILPSSLASATYTGIYAADTTQANSNFYFIKVTPDDFNKPYEIKYKVVVWCPANSNYWAMSECQFMGAGTGRNGFSILNTLYNTSYRPVYYHTWYTGTSAANGHIFGIGLRNSLNPTSSSYPRSIFVEILEATYCTVSLVTPALASSFTGRSTLSEYNFYSNGHFPNDNSNTTYTFADGTNSFTVTPSGGTAQTVNVTPSIANNITGTGANGYLAKFNGTNTLTSGALIGTGTSLYLREDGTWAAPESDSGPTIVWGTADPTTDPSVVPEGGIYFMYA